MNTNTIARIANSLRINTNNNLNNTNNNLNTNTNTNASVKEDTSMNTNPSARRNPVARSARRAAAALLALGGLLAASHTAHADIVVDKLVGPQGVYSYDAGQPVVAAGVTALQLKIRNTDSTTVSGITVQTYVYLASALFTGWTVRAMPALTNQTLGPNQSKWVTLPIPQMARQGFSLYNQMLWAKAVVGSHEIWVTNALDRPADNVLAGIPQHTSGSSTFTIKFTNNGTQNAPAKHVTVTATPSNNEGPVVALSSVVPQTLSLPALLVGQSSTLTFTMPARPTNPNNYAEFCALDIRIADPLIGYSADSSSQVYY